MNCTSKTDRTGLALIVRFSGYKNNGLHGKMQTVTHDEDRGGESSTDCRDCGNISCNDGTKPFGPDQRCCFCAVLQSFLRKRSVRLLLRFPAREEGTREPTLKRRKKENRFVLLLFSV